VWNCREQVFNERPNPQAGETDSAFRPRPLPIRPDCASAPPGAQQVWENPRLELATGKKKSRTPMVLRPRVAPGGATAQFVT
jgi:hypothetical protein